MYPNNIGKQTIAGIGKENSYVLKFEASNGLIYIEFDMVLISNLRVLFCLLHACIRIDYVTSKIINFDRANMSSTSVFVVVKLS